MEQMPAGSLFTSKSDIDKFKALQDELANIKTAFREELDYYEE